MNDLKRDNKYLKQQNQEMAKQINELKTLSFVWNLEQRMPNKTMSSWRHSLDVIIWNFSVSRTEQMKLGSNRRIKCGNIWERSLAWTLEKLKLNEHTDYQTKAPQVRLLWNSYFTKTGILFYGHTDRKVRMTTTRIRVADKRTMNYGKDQCVWVRTFQKGLKRCGPGCSFFFKSCREAGTTAYLRYGTFVVEGQPFIYDEERGRPVPKKVYG